MRNAQKAGWATSLVPALNDFFDTRKKAREALLDRLTASPTSPCVLKPAILVGGPFYGTVKVCITKDEIRNWGHVATADNRNGNEKQN